MGDRKHFLIVIRPGQRQGPLVSFHNKIFENIIRIGFVLKIKNTYIVPTLVLTRVCRPWVMHHVDTPTTFSELTSPKQPRWSEIAVSLYAASNSDCPQEPIVLRNHHQIQKPYHMHLTVWTKSISHHVTFPKSNYYHRQILYSESIIFHLIRSTDFLKENNPIIYNINKRIEIK